MREFIFILASLLLLPSIVFAEEKFATCHFDRECLEDEACTGTEFDLTVIREGADAFIIRTDAETIKGLAFDNHTPDAPQTLIGRSDSAYFMLTIAPGGGAARYTAHLSGPMMISYMGKCEGMK